MKTISILIKRTTSFGLALMVLGVCMTMVNINVGTAYADQSASLLEGFDYNSFYEASYVASNVSDLNISGYGTTYQTTGVSGTAGVTYQTTGTNTSERSGVSATPTDDLTKAYTRFEVHQIANKNLSGIFRVESLNYRDSSPYSVSEGESFTTFLQFPELTGPYEVSLVETGQSAPIFLAEGELKKVDQGAYEHRFINGTANPEYLELSPQETGFIVATGSIKARLTSCVKLYNPVKGVLSIGVDSNGDGQITGSELATRALNNTNDTCVDSPETSVPLTSLYKSEVRQEDGNIIAENSGLYDFLNKSGVDSRKFADPASVRQFNVKWYRTPVATSIEVANESLYEPPVVVNVVPQEEEVTGDIIQNGTEETTVPIADDTEASEELTEDNGLAQFAMKYWVLLSVGLGALIALGWYVKSVTLGSTATAHR